ncbi:MAG: hypothetical protein ABSG49_02830 [Methanoregula sp.]|uniref:hypothetical protein n=1 Tax=Methanoregula sp. TaxID=2052170 RepID=UPI003C17ABF3
MTKIPLLENSEGLFMAGEDLDRILRDLCHWKGDLRTDSRTVLHRYGTVCPAQGCHRCTNSDCPYADFIRQYWRHPRFD